MNSPFLLVLVSKVRFIPPWNSILTATASIGCPFSSRILPRTPPVWAVAIDAEMSRAARAISVRFMKFSCLISWTPRLF